MTKEQEADNELQKRFLKCYHRLIKVYERPSHIYDKSGVGWEACGLKVVPLYLDLQQQVTKIERGGGTVEQFYNRYIKLFDTGFDKYLGLEKPQTVWELLSIFSHMLYCEHVLRYEQNSLVISMGEVVGIWYLYNCRVSSKSAYLGIGILSELRGSGLATGLIGCYIVKFMNCADPELIRLTAVIESDNDKSLNLFKRFGFIPEGSAENYYNDNADVELYTYVVKKGDKVNK